MALILVVDDDLTFRALLCAVIEEMGHEVITASDGTEGMKMAKEHVPHVIVSDIMMPEMDGVEFNMRLQADPRTKGIPVLMLTGSMDKHMEVSSQLAWDLQFEYIVGKMAPMEQIAAIVKEMLDRYYQI